MHSWRVLILPFLDQQSLYNQYDFREPWNGPNNIKLLNSMPSVLRLPEPASEPRSLTSYVGDHRTRHDVSGHRSGEIRG